ncbi:MAG: DUF4920 domain-containing protein [Myxococcota bacterium]
MLRLAVLLLALGACTSNSADPRPKESAPPPQTPNADRGTRPETREQVDPDGVIRRGEALTSARALSVAEVYEKAESRAGQRVKVRGQVDKACSKKGCWMTLQGDTQGPPIRVTALGYGFFVPKGSPGMEATVEGEFRVKSLSVEEAQHYENDRVEGTDQEPRSITAPVLEGALVAQGLELRSNEPTL